VRGWLGLIAPQIQFQLMLPTQNYQGKYLQLGCGGYCGTDTLSTPAASYGCVPVTTGQFAEATDNEGHAGAVFSGAFGADPPASSPARWSTVRSPRPGRCTSTR
jgi:tannase/feruloyl esterase